MEKIELNPEAFVEVTGIIEKLRCLTTDGIVSFSNENGKTWFILEDMDTILAFMSWLNAIAQEEENVEGFCETRGRRIALVPKKNHSPLIPA